MIQVGGGGVRAAATLAGNSTTEGERRRAIRRSSLRCSGIRRRGRRLGRRRDRGRVRGFRRCQVPLAQQTHDERGAQNGCDVVGQRLHEDSDSSRRTAEDAPNSAHPAPLIRETGRSSPSMPRGLKPGPGTVRSAGRRRHARGAAGRRVPVPFQATRDRHP